MNLEDWRKDEKLAKAKMLLANKNNNFKEISRATGIGYHTLLNYRHDLSKLDTASGKVWNLLAQCYDKVQEKS